MKNSKTIIREMEHEMNKEIENRGKYEIGFSWKDFVIFMDFYKYKLSQLKNNLYWTAFDYDNPPKEDKVYIVKINNNSNVSYYIAKYIKETKEWVNQMNLLREAKGTLYKPLEPEND